ncbi:MAG TPA: cytochrome-c oxidase, cbb3-type subunit III [Devosiaceae bacterium]
MAVIERDPHTGHGTTGHEWNGIKELNTAVPWPVWAFLTAAVMFAVLWWILMPAWPLGTTYTRGLLGADVRHDVAAGLRTAAQERAIWTTRIDNEDFITIAADAGLMRDVRETGHTLFGDNCAACHGADATGGPGFPNLTDRAWLWGGTPQDVFETIRVGVNSGHPESRASQMPAWGRDGMLDRNAIAEVADYVYSLSHDAGDAGIAPARLTSGATVFAENCAACHGEDATGNPDIGAPDLTDGFWLYGGDRDSIYRTVFNGREGHMPTWEQRLCETDRKVLALYVTDLGRRQ